MSEPKQLAQLHLLLVAALAHRELSGFDIELDCSMRALVISRDGQLCGVWTVAASWFAFVEPRAKSELRLVRDAADAIQLSINVLARQHY